MNKSRTALIILIAVMTMAFAAIPSSGAEEIKRLYFEDVGVSLEMPDSVQYITMDMIKNHSFPNNSDFSFEEYREYFEQNNIYVLGYMGDEDGAITVRIQEAPSGLTLTNDDPTLTLYYQNIIAISFLRMSLKDAGYIVWDYNVYEGEKYPGIWFHNEYYDGTPHYSITYVLIEDGRMIQLTANIPGVKQEFPEDREQIIREIFNTIQVDPLPETGV